MDARLFPALPALNLALPSDWLNSRWYTDISSMRPLKVSSTRYPSSNSFCHPPIPKGLSLVVLAYGASFVPLSSPSKYNLIVPEVFLVAITWYQIPGFTGVVIRPLGLAGSSPVSPVKNSSNFVFRLIRSQYPALAGLLALTSWSEGERDFLIMLFMDDFPSLS